MKLGLCPTTCSGKHHMLFIGRINWPDGGFYHFKCEFCPEQRFIHTHLLWEERSRWRRSSMNIKQKPSASSTMERFSGEGWALVNQSPRPLTTSQRNFLETFTSSPPPRSETPKTGSKSSPASLSEKKPTPRLAEYLRSILGTK